DHPGRIRRRPPHRRRRVPDRAAYHRPVGRAAGAAARGLPPGSHPTRAVDRLEARRGEGERHRTDGGGGHGTSAGGGAVRWPARRGALRRGPMLAAFVALILLPPGVALPLAGAMLAGSAVRFALFIGRV